MPRGRPREATSKSTARARSADARVSEPDELPRSRSRGRPKVDEAEAETESQPPPPLRRPKKRVVISEALEPTPPEAPPAEGVEGVEVGEKSKRASLADSLPRMTYTYREYATPDVVIFARTACKSRPVAGPKIWTEGKLLEHTDIPCWWCRHKFDTVPLGLPIKKHKTQSVDGFTPNCYEVEGVLCSFACMLAYRNSQTSMIYKESTPLIYDMQEDMLGIREPIIPAMSWKIIDTHGGWMSIKKFRECRKGWVVTENFTRPVVQVPTSAIAIRIKPST